MIDLKLLVNNLDLINNKLKKRGKNNLNLKNIVNYLEQKKKLLLQLETHNHNRKIISKRIGLLITKNINNINDKKIKALKQKILANTFTKKELDLEIIDLNLKIKNIADYIPNIPHYSVPEGVNENDNIIVRKWNCKPLKTFDETVTHDEIVKKFKLVDFLASIQMSGTRFVSYINDGATLLRGLINFLLDKNINCGYKEMWIPLIVKSNAVYGTSQLPKFHQEIYKTDNDSYLISTSEISLINSLANKIIDINQLPIKLTAYSPCFRKEAGAAGKNNKGILRLHQFNKVEIVSISNPNNSFQMLEEMTNHIESILQSLEIPYRVVSLCGGELGFSSSKTYDIEVWMPSKNKYVEISSISNCTDFQARRLNIKFLEQTNKNYVHILNGSSLAIDRLIACILENNIINKNKIIIPKNLISYFKKPFLELKF